MRPLPHLLLSLFFLTLAHAVSLADFQPINGFSSACTEAYSTPMRDCTTTDFGNGNVCSVSCIAFLEALTDVLNKQCKGTSALPSTLMGLFFIQKGTSTLCPNVLGSSTNPGSLNVGYSDDQWDGSQQEQESQQQGGSGYEGQHGQHEQATQQQQQKTAYKTPKVKTVVMITKVVPTFSQEEEGGDKLAPTSTTAASKKTTSSKDEEGKASSSSEEDFSRTTSSSPTIATITSTRKSSRSDNDSDSQTTLRASRSKSPSSSSLSSSSSPPSNTGGSRNGGGGTVLDIGSSASPNARGHICLRACAVLLLAGWWVVR